MNYADGVFMPGGQDWPNPREVSNLLFQQNGVINDNGLLVLNLIIDFIRDEYTSGNGQGFNARGYIDTIANNFIIAKNYAYFVRLYD